jgi:hypothetical protein
MKRIRTFIVSSIVAGFLIVVPLYLAMLLLLKAMASLAGLVRPFASLLRRGPYPGGQANPGAGRDLAVRSDSRLRGHPQPDAPDGGAGAGERVEAGVRRDRGRAGALVHHRGARGRAVHGLRPFGAHACAGAVYVLARERVHPFEIPFTQAMKPLSTWGAGCRDLVVAMTT